MGNTALQSLTPEEVLVLLTRFRYLDTLLVKARQERESSPESTDDSPATRQIKSMFESAYLDRPLIEYSKLMVPNTNILRWIYRITRSELMVFIHHRSFDPAYH